jgi:hypothetical protein
LGTREPSPFLLRLVSALTARTLPITMRKG